jgi:hypothetical protein
MEAGGGGVVSSSRSDLGPHASRHSAATAAAAPPPPQRHVGSTTRRREGAIPIATPVQMCSTRAAAPVLDAPPPLNVPSLLLCLMRRRCSALIAAQPLRRCSLLPALCERRRPPPRLLFVFLMAASSPCSAARVRARFCGFAQGRRGGPKAERPKGRKAEREGEGNLYVGNSFM